MTAIRAQVALWLGLALVRRRRTLTQGFTPFYAIRAGSLVSLPALFAAPPGFVVLLPAKVGGVYPATLYDESARQDAGRKRVRIGGSSTTMS